LAKKKTPPTPFRGPGPPGPPHRQKGWKNIHVRPREHLTDDEVRAIRKAAGKIGRNKHRDATMIWMAYRHGLRASEVVRWRWDRISFKKEEVWIERAKGGESGYHTLQPLEMKALDRLPGKHKGWVFKAENSEEHISESALHKIVDRAAKAAVKDDPDLEIDFLVHPHMLRHACGYVMHKEGRDIRDIQVWLGHRNIQNTVRYTKLDAERFRQSPMWDEEKGERA
jgi:type 1 fimbriae regulatory protein FimE